MSDLTPREEETYDAITKYRANHPGATIMLAAEKTGTAAGTYYSAAKKLGIKTARADAKGKQAAPAKAGKRKYERYQAIPTAADPDVQPIAGGQLVMVMGSPEQIAKMLREGVR